MKGKYLVSVEVGGKCVDLYWTDNLETLYVDRVLYKGCDLDVYDMADFRKMLPEIVEQAIVSAGERLKGQVNRVFCVETREVYASVWDCHLKTGINRKSIYTSINRGTAANKLHFRYCNGKGDNDNGSNL